MFTSMAAPAGATFSAAVPSPLVAILPDIRQRRFAWLNRRSRRGHGDCV